MLRENEDDEDEDEDDVAAEAEEESRAEAELDLAAAAVDRPAADPEAFAFGSEIACMADSATVVATRLLAETRVTVRPMGWT